VRTTRILSAALSAVLLLTAACGGDDDTSGDNAGRAVVTTTTAPGTTTTAADTTTAAAGATTTTGVPSDLAAGPNYVTTEGPSGAGCSPGQTATTLSTGWWAGEITSVGESSIDLDLVCFFVGDAAAQAADEDGTDETDDYYVRNSNPRTFSIEFPPGTAPASCTGFDPEPFACTVNDVLTLYRTTDTTGTSVLDGHELFPFPLVWVHIAGTTGDYLYMQYTP
jgi:hypothetical protein